MKKEQLESMEEALEMECVEEVESWEAGLTPLLYMLKIRAGVDVYLTGIRDANGLITAWKIENDEIMLKVLLPNTENRIAEGAQARLKASDTRTERDGSTENMDLDVESDIVGQGQSQVGPKFILCKLHLEEEERKTMAEYMAKKSHSPASYEAAKKHARSHMFFRNHPAVAKIGRLMEVVEASGPARKLAYLTAAGIAMVLAAMPVASHDRREACEQMQLGASLDEGDYFIGHPRFRPDADLPLTPLQKLAGTPALTPEKMIAECRARFGIEITPESARESYEKTAKK